MNYYLLGIIFGIVVACGVALIIWALRRRRNPDSGKYDERQLLGRGKAFQAGFYTVISAAALVSIADYAQWLPGEPFVWHISAVMLGILVFALTAIHYDAYVGMYDKPERFIVAGVLFCIAMGLSGISNLLNGHEEGKVLACLNFELIVAWVSIVIALLIRKARAKAEEAE